MLYKEFRDIVRDQKKRLRDFKIKLTYGRKRVEINGKKETLFQLFAESPASKVIQLNGKNGRSRIEHNFTQTKELEKATILSVIHKTGELFVKFFVYGRSGTIVAGHPEKEEK